MRVAVLWRTRRALFEAVSKVVARPIRLSAFAIGAGLGVELYVASLVIASTANVKWRPASTLLEQSRCGFARSGFPRIRERLLNLSSVKDVELIGDFGDAKMAAAAATSALAPPDRESSGCGWRCPPSRSSS